MVGVHVKWQSAAAMFNRVFKTFLLEGTIASLGITFPISLLFFFFFFEIHLSVDREIYV